MAATYQKPVVYLSPTASVRGEILTIDDSEKPVYTFNTIPFAKPPVGDLRFKKPVPIDLWEGEKDVRKQGHSPAQNESYMEMFDNFPMPKPASCHEDCLNLLVSSPDISGTRKLPVMAFIYGGSFQAGSIYSYPGTALASMGDVVYVAINYRVNALGFFSTGDNVCPGNFGIWDQIEGLRWIQKYISKFGGNPDNVTIFGESAGSMSLGLHYVMPQSQGLFKQGLAQSGASSCPSGMLENQADIDRYKKQTAQALGLQENASSEALLAAFNALSSDELIAKTSAIEYGPCVDNDLLTDSYYNLYLARKFHPKTCLFGVNSDEGAMFIAMYYAAMFGGLKTMADLRAFLDHCLSDCFPRMTKRGHVDAIVNEYITTADPPEEAIYKAACDVLGDLLLSAPILENAKLHSAVVSKGTYLYAYGYRISFSKNPPWLGADHADELPLVFGMPFLTKTATTKMNVKYTPEDKAVSRMLISCWTNFAKTGNPNGSGLPEWKLFTPGEPNYLFIDRNCSQGADYKASRVKFWRETFPNL